MRLANRIPEKRGEDGVANDVDPRDEAPAEVIDLASRTAYPQVAKPGGKSDAMGMVAGIALVAALGAVTLWSMNSARVDDPQGAGIGGEQAVAPATPARPGVPAQPAVATTVAPPVAVVADPAPSAILSNAPGTEMAPVANPYSSPTVVFDASALPAPIAAAIAPGGMAETTPGSGSTEGLDGASAFASRVGGVGGAAAKASAMANPTTTVTQGTLIPAILETAIDTNVPGFVRAVVSQDVKSFDGSKVLVPRSSRLIGQYQSGLQNGQKRAYVIWTRLIRPDGASVSLGSPAIGFDGTTGLQGKVSGNGFFKRFGSAMLLSVVGGLGGLASGGASVVLGGASQSAASVAAQSDSQRGPTVRVRQGEPIRVFTARDLDFSQVG